MGRAFPMNALRRRLASGALALTVLQFALLFTAPVAAYCLPGGARAASVGREDVDCCPPGAHPRGECPLHRGARSEPPSPQATAGQGAAQSCRMMCDAPHGPQVLLVAIGMLSAPQATTISLTAHVLPAGAPVAINARPSTPDAPPPKLL
jgi:hypothetical protein